MGILSVWQENVLDGMLVYHRTPHAEVRLCSPRNNCKKLFGNWRNQRTPCRYMEVPRDDTYVLLMED